MVGTIMNLDTSLPFGFNVIGFPSCNFGLGIAARNTIAALVESGHQVAVYDIPLPGRSGADSAWKHLSHTLAEPPRFAVNLFHVNPPQQKSVKTGMNHGFATVPLNVAVPYWELPRIPEQWKPELEKTDIVLAPSRFIEYAIASWTSRCRVLYYPQAIMTTATPRPDRAAFGLPDNCFLFVTSVDIGSDMVRKNPVGAIDAFRLAFDREAPAMLILKLNKTVGGSVFDTIETKLRGYIAGDPRIRILDYSMTYETILSLYASCDCYVSLHRSEGLGMGVMEAMMLGKPVIATFWSGTADFMTLDNSCPVSYSIVNCDPIFNPGIRPESLGFQGVWAEPDLNEAASWMRHLESSPDRCVTIGAEARRYMLERRKLMSSGETFRFVRIAYEHYSDNIYSRSVQP
ncbi:MAG: glycosyltransferase family 4 protein [Chitinispirillaceae bacterium]|nr:glycosyltransferase family 4 protein [Chitinispirillaceae bacterium]